MSENGSNFGRVQIKSESLAARWLASQSYNTGRPLASLIRHSRPRMVFVENELLVDSRDTDTQHMLAEEFNAEITPFPPLPPLPEGLDPERARPVEEMPLPVTVRLPAEQAALDELEEAARLEPEGRLEVTSLAGAGTLSLLRRLLRDERRVMPNLVGRPTTLPLRASTEGLNADGTSNAYAWPEFSGPANITRAWMLYQAYAQVASVRSPIYLGIIDSGFNLGPDGRPVVVNGQPPEVTDFIQWNLFYDLLADYQKPMYEALGENRFAGGPNNEAGKRWHGNWVLSTAAAPVNNNNGAAGTGGITVEKGGYSIKPVMPVLFKMYRSARETIRGIQLCVAWGVDVVNMSFSITYDAAIWQGLDPGFPSSLWEKTFQFAADQSLVMLASAGNDNQELPENVVLPATRTPGVITVGAIDTPTGNRAASFSNYGSSVDIWAPGTSIHVMPDQNPGSANGSLVNGTSFSAPLVAGIVGLMKTIRTTLRGDEVKEILRQTGYKNSPDPKVSVGINAYAALLHMMGGGLPDAFGEEPNNTPQTARPMVLTPLGSLATGSITLLSRSGDEDWHSFEVNEYATVTVSLDYLPELSWMTVDLVPDDPENRAPSDEVRTTSGGRKSIRIEQAAPGIYRLRVRGGGPNMYELRVHRVLKPLVPDIFEENDSAETAARLNMNPPSGGGLSIEEGLFTKHIYSPGIYEANLHTASDHDFYHIQGVSALALVKALFRITSTDSPIDAILYGPDGAVRQVLLEKRSLEFELPAPECWVRISGSKPNRYRFQAVNVVNKDNDPGAWEKVDVSPVPHWLPDPPFEVMGWERFLQVEINTELKEIGKLVLDGDPGLRLDLVARTGEVVATASHSELGDPGSLEIELTGIEPGTYIARVGRDIPPAARFEPGSNQHLARFQLRPGW